MRLRILSTGCNRYNRRLRILALNRYNRFRLNPLNPLTPNPRLHSCATDDLW